MLWKFHRGVITTATHVARMRPGIRDKCPVWGSEGGTLKHCFMECKLTRDFWKLVGQELQVTGETKEAIEISLIDIVLGFGQLRKSQSGSGVLHGLVAWEIYRTCTQALLG